MAEMHLNIVTLFQGHMAHRKETDLGSRRMLRRFHICELKPRQPNSDSVPWVCPCHVAGQLTLPSQLCADTSWGLNILSVCVDLSVSVSLSVMYIILLHCFTHEFQGIHVFQPYLSFPALSVKVNMIVKADSHQCWRVRWYWYGHWGRRTNGPAGQTGCGGPPHWPGNWAGWVWTWTGTQWCGT